MMTISIEQAKELTQGCILHHKVWKNADGTPRRFKVTSVKTWVRTPNRVEVRVKRGLHEHNRLTASDLEHFEIAPEMFHISYRDELMFTVKAADSDEALFLVRNGKWDSVELITPLPYHSLQAE